MAKTLSRALGTDLASLAELLRSKGRGKDTILAHINPREAALLKKAGGSGVDTGGGFRGTTSTPLKTDTTTKTTTPTTNVVTTADPTAEPLIVTGTTEPTIDTVDVVDQEEEIKPYTPFEEDFPLQTDEEKLRISPTVIPKKPSQPSRATKNAKLSTGLGIDTNVASLLGTGLSSRPDVSSTSAPYLLGKDDKRKDVWNTESLRGALGI
jgi:hypothetical protein